MKQSCFAAIFAACFAGAVQAQKAESNLPGPYQKATAAAPQSDPPNTSYELPMSDGVVSHSFLGKESELLQFLSENIRYPEQAKRNNVQGKVVVTFIVEKNGAISDITILRDIGDGCGKEAARVVAAMPNWTPGRPVRVRYTLPVRFKLEAPEEP